MQGNERFILSGGSAGELVPINIDGVMQERPATVATYYAVSELVNRIDQLTGVLAQAIFRLDALHAHASAREHANARGQKVCPICSGQFVEAAQVEEAVGDAEEAVAANIDAIVSDALTVEAAGEEDA